MSSLSLSHFGRFGSRTCALWYWLGSLTYPLYLVHNVIGKHVYAQLSFSPWTNVACVIVLVLGIATIMAVTIEQRGCAMLQRYLLAKRPRILTKQ